MILSMDEWIFDIDLQETIRYSEQESKDHCTCAYCRNFYEGIDHFYPNLRGFLDQFGVSIEAPEQQFPYDFLREMYYDSIYAVCGTILQKGSCPLELDSVIIQPLSADEEGPHVSLYPYFYLDVSTVKLPWLLDEPLQDTISPANDALFLDKMQARLLEKADTTPIQ